MVLRMGYLLSTWCVSEYLSPKDLLGSLAYCHCVTSREIEALGHTVSDLPEGHLPPLRDHSILYEVGS